MSIVRHISKLVRRKVSEKLAEIYTNEVAQVISYNSSNNTVEVQPVVQRFRSTDANKLATFLAQPIKDVPVKQIGGGKLWITGPAAVGSYGALNFSDRCISQWKQNGGILPPKSARKFDVNDCWFSPGLTSLSEDDDNGFIQTGISEDRISLRTRSGQTEVSVFDDETVEVRNASGSVVIDISGNVTVNGGTDTAIAFSRMKTAFDTLKTELNAFVTIFNAHIHPTPSGPSSPTGTPASSASADMTSAESNTVEIP